MNSDNFVSVFFHLDGSKVEYGLLKWVSHYFFSSRKTETRLSSSSDWSYESLQFELTETNKNRCNVSEVVEAIQTEASSHLLPTGRNSSNCLILEDIPETQTLKKMIKGFSVKTVSREGSTTDQIMRFAPQIGDKLSIPDEWISKPDLVFDNLGDNLIDPVLSDLDTFYPLTQSLLIAGHYFDSIYKGGGIAVGYADRSRNDPFERSRASRLDIHRMLSNY